VAGCDVVVIGAGISGLTAAALLSRAGLTVRVAEEQPRAGGYLQGFTRGGFTFDTSVHWLNDVGAGGFVSRLLSFVGEDWPRCRALRRIWRFKGDSFDYLLTEDPEELRQRLATDFPAEADGLARLFADSRYLGEQLRLNHDRMRAPETMNPLARIRLGLTMLAWFLPLRRFLRSGAEEGLARYFRGGAIGRVFCAEERLASLMVPLAWSYEKDFFAAPAGGSQAWVRWLVERIRSAGSEVRLGCAVQRVLIEDGRAAGVELADGERLRARWVVAACDVERLYERMLPAAVIPAPLRRKLAAADLYNSCVMVFCGLSCTPEELGLGEEMIRLTRDGLTRDAHASGDPTTTALLLLAPSARDRTLAPPGKSTLTIQCPAFFDQHERWQTGPGFLRGKAYRTCKHAFADALLDRVEQQLLPGLRKRIEVLEVGTPITLWRYSANRAGSIMGGRPTDRNIRARIAHYRTPLPRLLLAGHWAEYGGGVPLAVKAAANTSLLILAQERPAAFRALARLMDGRPAEAPQVSP
jgi:phytoene dehydrogenase-like protein